MSASSDKSDRPAEDRRSSPAPVTTREIVRRPRFLTEDIQYEDVMRDDDRRHRWDKLDLEDDHKRRAKELQLDRRSRYYGPVQRDSTEYGPLRRRSTGDLNLDPEDSKNNAANTSTRRKVPPERMPRSGPQFPNPFPAPTVERRGSIAVDREHDNDFRHRHINKVSDVLFENKVNAIWDHSQAPDITINLRLPVLEDLDERLEEFCRLHRLGDFTSARRFFAENLQDHLAKPHVLVHYVEMLLEQGDYRTMSELGGPDLFSTFGYNTLEGEDMALLKSYLGLMYAYQGCFNYDALWRPLNCAQLAMTELFRIKNAPTRSSTEIKMISLLYNLSDMPMMGRRKSWIKKQLDANLPLSARKTLYKSLLREGRVWDLRDILVAKCFEGSLDEVLGEISDGKYFNELLASFIADWKGSSVDFDAVTTTALLDLLMSMLNCSLEDIDSWDETREVILDHATPLAISIVENDPTLMVTRPFSRWIIAKARFANAQGRNPSHLLARHLDSSPGVAFEYCYRELPIYVPKATEDIGWKAEETTPERIRPIKLALKTARALGDYRTEAIALEALIRLSTNPAKEFSELGDLQKLIQGDFLEYSITLGSKYLVSDTTASRDDLKDEITELLTLKGFAELCGPSHYWFHNMLKFVLVGQGPEADKALKEAYSVYSKLPSRDIAQIDRAMPDFKERANSNAKETSSQSSSDGIDKELRLLVDQKITDAEKKYLDQQKQSKPVPKQSEKQTHVVERSETGDDLAPEGQSVEQEVSKLAPTSKGPSRIQEGEGEILEQNLAVPESDPSAAGELEPREKLDRSIRILADLNSRLAKLSQNNATEPILQLAIDEQKKEVEAGQQSYMAWLLSKTPPQASVDADVIVDEQAKEKGDTDEEHRFEYHRGVPFIPYRERRTVSPGLSSDSSERSDFYYGSRSRSHSRSRSRSRSRRMAFREPRIRIDERESSPPSQPLPWERTRTRIIERERERSPSLAPLPRPRFIERSPSPDAAVRVDTRNFERRRERSPTPERERIRIVQQDRTRLPPPPPRAMRGPSTRIIERERYPSPPVSLERTPAFLRESSLVPDYLRDLGDRVAFRREASRERVSQEHEPEQKLEATKRELEREQLIEKEKLQKQLQEARRELEAVRSEKERHDREKRMQLEQELQLLKKKQEAQEELQRREQNQKDAVEAHKKEEEHRRLKEREMDLQVQLQSALYQVERAEQNEQVNNRRFAMEELGHNLAVSRARDLKNLLQAAHEELRQNKYSAYVESIESDISWDTSPKGSGVLRPRGEEDDNQSSGSYSPIPAPSVPRNSNKKSRRNERPKVRKASKMRVSRGSRAHLRSDSEGLVPLIENAKEPGQLGEGHVTPRKTGSAGYVTEENRWGLNTASTTGRPQIEGDMGSENVELQGEESPSARNGSSTPTSTDSKGKDEDGFKHDSPDRTIIPTIESVDDLQSVGKQDD